MDQGQKVTPENLTKVQTKAKPPEKSSKHTLSVFRLLNNNCY